MKTGPNQDVWAIVRCFNEARVVGDVVEELRLTFPNVVGVDDGSTDGSSQVLRRAGASVVRHGINLGAGAALQTGLEFALLDPGANYFLSFDADGQHRVSDAAAMVQRLRTEPLDVIMGSRFLGTTNNIPHTRRFLLKMARKFEGVTSGVHLTDAHNGLRAFTRRFASLVHLKTPDMAYASELLEAIARSGLPYAEHPVEVTYSEYSLAKGQRSINSVNIALDLCLNRLLARRHE